MDVLVLSMGPSIDAVGSSTFPLLQYVEVAMNAHVAQTVAEEHAEGTVYNIRMALS